MNFWIVTSVLAFLLSFVAARILIYQILLIAFRRSLFDLPNERKIHRVAVPRLGGTSFKPVVCFSLAILLGISLLLGYDDLAKAFAGESRLWSLFLSSVIVLYFVGLTDDLVGVRYRVKFVAQIFCGLMMIAGGLYIESLHGLFFLDGMPLYLAYPLTILAVVFIINAINLIDGIDGLASGFCGVVLLYYGLMFLGLGEYLYSLLSFSVLGALVAFFYYNVFGDARRGRKIFMGDTGSLTVGLTICFLGMKLMQSVSMESVPCTTNAFVLAFSPLIVPCFDVVRVFSVRIRNGRSPFLPDKNHIHHKLLAVGMSQCRAMMTIIFVSVVLTLLNIMLSQVLTLNLVFVCDIIIWVLIDVGLNRCISNRRKA